MLAEAAGEVGQSLRPAVLSLAAGRLYLPTGKVPASSEELDVVTAVFGHVVGPGGAPCVVLASDPATVHHVAAIVAMLTARLPATHPHPPWGALVTAAASEPALKAVGEQVADMGGDVVVVYDERRGDLQGLTEVCQLCQKHTAGFVVVASPAHWSSLVRSGVPDFLPLGSAVIRFPEPSARTVAQQLGAHAAQLTSFHGMAVPEAVVAGAANEGGGDLPDVRMRPVPGQHPDPVTVGMMRLRQWATRHLLDGQHSGRLGPAQLATTLRATVIGQDRAVAALARHVCLGAAGVRLRADRPRSAVLLTGSTGTGKTLLATTLARALSVPLIRVDLAAYTEPQKIATLLGSPPGYIGSTEDANWLTTRIAAAPNAVLLLDEFDKATPGLWRPLLMELLGAGTLTDEQGTTVSCRGLHVVLTANTGAGELTRGPTGFGAPAPGERADAAAAAVRRLLPEEVFNRLDDVLVLHPIGPRALASIVDATLTATHEKAAVLGYELAVSSGARQVLLAEVTHDSDGARRVHRTLERWVLGPLLEQPAGSYQVVRAGRGVRVRAVDAAAGRGRTAS